MEFRKNHNLTDGALARIGQSVGKDVELPEKQAQADDAELAEQRAQELLQMVEAELMGLSPTVSQLVLERFVEDLSVMPTYRKTPRAKREAQTDITLNEVIAGDWEERLYGLMDEIFDRMEQIREIAKEIPGSTDRTFVKELAQEISTAISNYNQSLEDEDLRDPF